jgi:hypothetical protein
MPSGKNSAIKGGDGDEMGRAALDAGEYTETWKDIVTIHGNAHLLQMEKA